MIISGYIITALITVAIVLGVVLSCKIKEASEANIVSPHIITI